MGRAGLCIARLWPWPRSMKLALRPDVVRMWCIVRRVAVMSCARRIAAWGIARPIEACLHYLILSEEDLARIGGLGKVNPPIRPAAEREQLWRHLAAGNITIVSTDHVSWPWSGSLILTCLPMRPGCRGSRCSIRVCAGVSGPGAAAHLGGATVGRESGNVVLSRRK